MLVLSRKEMQEIVIGDDIVIRVVRARRGKVQIAIKAPKQMPIKRKELLLKPENNRLFHI